MKQLLIAVDVGSKGALAWLMPRRGTPGINYTERSRPVEYGVRSVERSIRALKTKTAAGNVKTRSYVDHKALEVLLRELIAAARALHPGEEIQVFALIEASPPMPGQGAATTASQNRSLGRTEATLSACGATVFECTSQPWRRHFGLRGGDTSVNNPKRGEATKANKEASQAKARELFAGLVPESDLDVVDRAESLLLLRYFEEIGVETCLKEQETRALLLSKPKSKSSKRSKSPRRSRGKPRLTVTEAEESPPPTKPRSIPSS